MPDEATMDAGLDTDQSVVDSGAETVETPVEGAEPQETTEQHPQQPYKAVTEDERGKSVLDQKARATIEELRQKDPEIAKAFRDALFFQDRINRALPGGLKEVQELRETLEQFGGEPGIQEAREKLAGWDSFDDQYMAGDPKALEFMLSTPESQQAFLKLAPMAMNKFEELNPEGYATYLCQRIMGDAIANRVPIALELTQHFLAAGDSAKATEELGKILGWFQRLDATSQKAITPPKNNTPNARDDPEFRQLQERDTQRTRDDWRNESAKLHNDIYASELTRLAAGRKLTDAERLAIQHEVQTNFDKRVQEDQKRVDSYFQSRDKDGYLKMAKTAGQKHLPELIRKAFDRFVTKKPGPKGQANQNGTPVRPPMGGKVEPGFVFVTQMPTRDQIDWANPFNSRQNIMQGKAITVDQKRVTWRKS